MLIFTEFKNICRLTQTNQYLLIMDNRKIKSYKDTACYIVTAMIRVNMIRVRLWLELVGLGLGLGHQEQDQ